MIKTVGCTAIYKICVIIANTTLCIWPECSAVPFLEGDSCTLKLTESQKSSLSLGEKNLPSVSCPLNLSKTTNSITAWSKYLPIERHRSNFALQPSFTQISISVYPHSMVSRQLPVESCSCNTILMIFPFTIHSLYFWLLLLHLWTSLTGQTMSVVVVAVVVVVVVVAKRKQQQKNIYWPFRYTENTEISMRKRKSFLRYGQ